MKQIALDNFVIGGGAPLVLIAGPCVIEDRDLVLKTALRLKETTAELGIPFIFKASYDKANRSSVKSFRGPGLKDGLAILAEVKEKYKIPVLSDVHRFEEIPEAAAVLDIVQVPAFLSRQTDFIIETARRAKIVNIKKGQFLAPWDIGNVIEKALSGGNENILITERGTSFGYNNLVSDFRSVPIIRAMGYPLVYDATHSVQLPGGAGNASSGDRSMIPCLARAAVAAGIDGIFFEVHPDPDKALCDGPNSMELEKLPELLRTLVEIDRIVKK
jgi:2-dehydro-3-deoxyphosphooctonate aldolase (KDO 8-P synthase)